MCCLRYAGKCRKGPEPERARAGKAKGRAPARTGKALILPEQEAQQGEASAAAHGHHLVQQRGGEHHRLAGAGGIFGAAELRKDDAAALVRLRRLPEAGTELQAFTKNEFCDYFIEEFKLSKDISKH